MEEDSTATFRDVRIGIFYADDDTHIATRIRDKFHELGCNVELCDFYDGGNSKLQAIHHFLSSKDAVLWLATDKSSTDELMTYMQDCGLYKAIVDSKFRFIPLQPQEYLRLKLPRILDAYTSLKEDESFPQRMKSTLTSVVRKISSSRLCVQSRVAGEDLEGVEYGFEQGPGSCARPDPNNHSLITSPGSATNVTYNVNVIGDDNRIQIGPECQIINDASKDAGT